MPCQSGPPHPSVVEYQNVQTFLAELDGTRPNYGDRTESVHTLTARLCARLKETDVTKYSLELQIWWRDHQAYDAKREADEKMEAAWAEKAKRAEAKLTPEDLLALRRAWRR